ncbi:MAG: tRNA adenosine(34) deaminase TadA [Actinomycetota bacterium]
MDDDEQYMHTALGEARRALEHGDVPIGAVAVLGGRIVASAHNARELTGDPTAHAEILALRDAAGEAGTWRLEGVTLYSTVEPCPMCAGALVAARIRRLVYGAPDVRCGAAWSIYNIPQDPRLFHRCEITAGVLEDRCAQLIQDFFAAKRDIARFL